MQSSSEKPPTFSSRLLRTTLVPLRPPSLLHLIERHQRVRVVIAQQRLARIPSPGFFDDRNAAPFEEVGPPSLRRFDEMPQLDHGTRCAPDGLARSEERRVGKECRSRWSPTD